VPQDATIVLLIGPRSDLGAADVAKLRDFLSVRGGRAIVTLDLNTERTPNLSGLLASYGIEVPSALVIEQEAVHFLPNQPVILVPTILEHAITSTLKSGEMPVVFPVARPIVPLEARKRRVSVEPLLATSARAWAQVDFSSQETLKRSGDLDGPFDLAVACTDLGEAGERESRIVVLSSSQFLFPPESIGRLPENENLFLNSLNWLRGREELIAIPARTISSIRYQLALTSFQFYLFSAVAVLLVPLAVFGVGLGIWLRRRHA